MSNSYKAKWNGFWFGTQESKTLSMLRIAIGAVFLLYLMNIYGVFSGNAISLEFPRHTFSIESQYRLDGYRLPIPGFGWLPVPSFDQYRDIENLLFVLAIFFTAGMFTRIVGSLMSLLFAYLFVLTQFSYHHYIFLLVLMLLIIGFSPCADYWSIDAYITHKPPKKRRVTPLRMLQVLTSTIYAFTIIHKLQAGWLEGKTIGVLMESGTFGGPLLPLLSHLVIAPLLPFTILLSMLFVAIGLWFPRTRLWAIAIGVLLHIGIDTTMDVGTFSYQMIALYLAFLPSVSKAQPQA